VVGAGDARSTYRKGIDVVVVEAVAAVPARHRSAADAASSAGVGWWPTASLDQRIAVVPAFRLSSTGKAKGDGSHLMTGGVR
jgi:hypothetical protein